jgi:hypothetical protein
MLQREALAASVDGSDDSSAAASAAGSSTATAGGPQQQQQQQQQLHPAWDQLVAADGQVLYSHRTEGQIDSAFTAAVRGGTCGGCLCDEVGLGKTLEVLYLTLAHPAGKETPFLRHLCIKTNILPRQARDKHRENSKKRWRFA